MSIAIVLSAAILSGCSQREKVLAEIRELYESGEYRETIAHCRHALRKDYREGEVYFYYGMSLVQLDRDYEGFHQLDLAVRKEPILGRSAASMLLKSGREAERNGDVEKARRRVKAAVTYRPGIELGAYKFVAGDAFFSEKDFEKSARFYKEAVRDFPDTVLVEQALYRLAISYEAIGLHARSIESFQQLLDDFPRGEFASEARWRLANLLYGQGESELERGNFEAVVEIVERLLDLTKNATLIQKSRFLRGEAYEGLGQFKKAYEEYRAIIRQDRGASGRIVERAQEKIVILRETGLI